VIQDEPEEALDALLGAVPELDEEGQRHQFEALLDGSTFAHFAGKGLARAEPILQRFESWLRWASQAGIISDPDLVAPGFKGPGGCFTDDENSGYD
jgi:hypothetical protein